MSENIYETLDSKSIATDDGSTSEKQIEIYEYEEGDVYQGSWNEEGKKHGIGTITFADTTVYSGIFRNGLFDGFGVMIFHDGTKFEGEFHNGKFHGFGVYTRFDGMKYEGRFCDGSPRGAGLITFPDGTNGSDPRYEGYFEGFKLMRQTEVTLELRKARKSAERAQRCQPGKKIT